MNPQFKLIIIVRRQFDIEKICFYAFQSTKHTSAKEIYFLNFYPVGRMKQGRKRPLDTLKRMIERRRERERKVEGEI